ncbi:RNA polymerase sigma factor [Pontivivens insulae]|uniref:Uncharacterized protein n=1 Tax=Pontivivens insulae TaxID=1639689 RepID=A0A2R8AEW6_9RHOB|nr:DUF6596 domain-containing protein [Pontivivens insulae]RED11823.1 RNA polymerase sigma-70 factor (ECF subfamily) [Pontivivens insulae]SPF30580.1 hypothetical protein POI8812_02919 [Pontivivens insulae]
MTDAAARATEVARASYGRLVALLAARSGDIAGAEDALGDAFARALQRWPEEGVPDRPDAWLMTVARNRMKDRWKSAAECRRAPEAAAEDIMAEITAIDPEGIPDARLRLMFVCAHPAIDAKVRTPLMLQVVLGLDVATIGPAFLVPPATLAQRLVRAKRKVRDAAIPFSLPGREHMPERLDAVLEAIYGAFSVEAGEELREEAVYLSDMMAALMPESAEVLGLGALLLFASARDAAARVEGRFVPLAEQNVGLWDRMRLRRAEVMLARAGAMGDLGRFQLEAAIQAVHCDRAKTGETDWRAIEHLYVGLMQTAPTVGAAVGQAAAVGEVHGPRAGLTALDRIEADALAVHQPGWAVRAHLLARDGQTRAAAAAYDRALGLSSDAAVRAWLSARRDALSPQRI